MRKHLPINIAFSVNNNYANHLIVTMYSLIMNASDREIVFHILSSDMSVESKRAIKTLASIKENIVIKFYSVNPSDFSGVPITMNYITIETYYRLMLAEILPKSVSSVLYLDADILVVGDVCPLFEIDIRKEYAAGAPDVYLNNDDEYKKIIGINSNLYLNAGVLLMNLDAIRENKLTDKLLKNAKRPHHKYQDQDAINVTFLGGVHELPRKYNYQVKDHQYDRLPDDEKVIIHYSGSLKPWNRDRLYDAFLELYDSYKLRASRYIFDHIDNTKYGLLKYSTDNVGDNVQGIAARRFLPQIDYYFERDNMDATKTNPGEVVKVIINGWWGDGPENWPPLDQNLDVLPISMYVEDRIQDEFKKPRSKQLLNFIGPIGARSRGTEKFLKKNNIDTYFSGCMTLTLLPDSRVKKRDYILAVDVSDEVYEVMLSQTSREVIRMDVMRHITTDVLQQYRLAEYYLYLYQSAHCVVTTRLHSMLPSIALGTPVLFINDILDDDDVRFSGLSNLAHNLSSSAYVSEPDKYHIDRPPKNSREYLTIKRQLEKSCAEFTGYDSKSSYLSTDVDELLADISLHQAFLSGLDEMGKLRKTAGDLKVSLRHKTNHVKELVAEVESLKDELHRTHESTSWKVTKPLRAAERRMRK